MVPPTGNNMSHQDIVASKALNSPVGPTSNVVRVGHNGPISRIRRALAARRHAGKSQSEKQAPVSDCWCGDISSQAAASAFRAQSDKSFNEHDFEGALIALNHELGIKRLTLGSGDAEVGRVLSHMAVRMTCMGPDYEFFALSAFAEALGNLQNSVGPGDEEAAIVAHNLWVLMHNVRVRQERKFMEQKAMPLVGSKNDRMKSAKILIAASA